MWLGSIPKSSGIREGFPRVFLVAMRFAFSDFRLDLSTRQLLHGGLERHLEPKAFDLLALLLTRTEALD
jgi:DNA-binding winged helix-turn-helix (wHTH) protein